MKKFRLIQLLTGINMRQLFRWAIYSMGFGALLTPLFIHFGLTSFWEIISTSFGVGFFAGILNDISYKLKSIDNQLRGRS